MDILLIILAIQAANTLVFVLSYRALLFSNVALRQQLGVYKRKQRRPALNNRDRVFWAWLSRLWPDWRSALVIVKPDTIIRWQKKRFRDFWKRKSKPGRPCIPRQHISFIRRISGDHPEYGEDRIALELEIKFGIKHSEATVRKYMVKVQRPPIAFLRTTAIHLISITPIWVNQAQAIPR
jgi:putative transposase